MATALAVAALSLAMAVCTAAAQTTTTATATTTSTTAHTSCSLQFMICPVPAHLATGNYVIWGKEDAAAPCNKHGNGTEFYFNITSECNMVTAKNSTTGVVVHSAVLVHKSVPGEVLFEPWPAIECRCTANFFANTTWNLGARLYSGVVDLSSVAGGNGTNKTNSTDEWGNPLGTVYTYGTDEYGNPIAINAVDLDGRSQFLPSIKLFPDDSFTQELKAGDVFPVTASRFHVQVGSNWVGDIIGIVKCAVSPTGAADDPFMQVVLEDSCAKGRFDAQPFPSVAKNIARLSFRKFKFVGRSSVYITCLVRRCTSEPCGECGASALDATTTTTRVSLTFLGTTTTTTTRPRLGHGDEQHGRRPGHLRDARQRGQHARDAAGEALRGGRGAAEGRAGGAAEVARSESSRDSGRWRRWRRRRGADGPRDARPGPSSTWERTWTGQQRRRRRRVVADSGALGWRRRGQAGLPCGAGAGPSTVGEGLQLRASAGLRPGRYRRRGRRRGGPGPCCGRPGGRRARARGPREGEHRGRRISGRRAVETLVVLQFIFRHRQCLQRTTALAVFFCRDLGDRPRHEEHRQRSNHWVCQGGGDHSNLYIVFRINNTLSAQQSRHCCSACQCCKEHRSFLKASHHHPLATTTARHQDVVSASQVPEREARPSKGALAVVKRIVL
mmetsp:Transcript_97448/g.314005  ORF Transcript_97448/g.314005 Transcript_97448/m.314005 type:complete len:670 (-) Transcript_97448:3971-5980(-)